MRSGTKFWLDVFDRAGYTIHKIDKNSKIENPPLFGSCYWFHPYKRHAKILDVQGDLPLIVAWRDPVAVARSWLAGGSPADWEGGRFHEQLAHMSELMKIADGIVSIDSGDREELVSDVSRTLDVYLDINGWQPVNTLASRGSTKRKNPYGARIAERNLHGVA